MFSRFRCSRGLQRQRINSWIIGRGLKVAVSDLRKGDWVDCEGRAMIVHQISSSFSGRGARHFQLMLKDPIIESFSALKPSSRDTFERLELKDIPFQFLYEADNNLHLLNTKTLEELVVPARLVGGNLKKLLEGGVEVKVRMDGDTPLMVHSATKNVKCTVTKVLERNINADRKLIVVETASGARINSSSLLVEGDHILVSLEDLGYVSKAI